MKRFWIVLLSAALVMAFAMTASAQTAARFSGHFIAAGQYFDNQELRKNNTVSTALYWQRMRLQTVFTVAPGLSITTRADILERVWGAQRFALAVSGTTSAPVAGAAGTFTGSTAPGYRNTATAFDDDNIGFDLAFFTFDTKVGRFQVGYQPAAAWGTAFGDSPTAHPRILYAMTQGPWTFAAIIEKQNEAEIVYAATSAGYLNPPPFTRSDADADFYYLSATNRWKGGEAGLLYVYNYNALGATGAAGTSRSKNHFLVPYVRANFGPLFVEAELNYGFGVAAEFIRPATPAAVVDMDNAGLGYYVNLRYKVGPLTVGGLYAFAQGDDPATANKHEGTVNAGYGLNPCLLLYNNSTVFRWAGTMGPRPTATTYTYSTTDVMSNTSFWQLNAAFDVTKDLRLFASYSVAKLDQKGALMSNDIGAEFDVTATYKIFGNLEYIVGLGYFWAGDAYKGTAAQNVAIGNNYTIQHRLNLTF